MALVLKDRVKETSTTTGTGTFTLAGAATGFQSFSVIGNSNTVYYAIVRNGYDEWEIGIGTYTSSGTTLSRDTVLESSNSGSKVNFSAGTKEVFCTYPAEKAVTIDDVQTLSNKTLASPSVTGSITFSDSSTQNTAATGFGFKNRIINGAMTISQRNGGASGTADASYPVDRWAYYSTQASKGTWQQTPSATETGYATRVGAGFTNYLSFTSSSAYSVVSSDYFLFEQRIEGNNASDLAWGTANAKTVTISFWVYSSLTGTFGGSIRNAGTFNYSYPFTFTINAANTWEYKTITVTGPTAGTWGSGTSGCISLSFGLGVGSTYSGTANTWSGSNYISATGATSVVGTSGATFYITGVQLEKGSTATSFDYRPYGTELALCQRYGFKRLADGSINDYAPLGTGRYYGTNAAQLYVPFPVTMRTSPSSITVSGTIIVNDLGFGSSTFTSPVLNETSCDGATVTGSASTGVTAGYATTFYVSGSGQASIFFNAEL